MHDNIATLLERAQGTLNDPESRRAAIAATVEFLLSGHGLKLIQSQIEACSLHSSPTVETWARDLATVSDGLDDATREKLANLVEAVVGRPSVVDMGDEELDVAAIAKLIGKGAAGWAAKGSGMPQWLEAIDDAFGIENVVRDGSVALLVTLALSSAMNAQRYRQGKLRWDDAIDNVAGDVIKATITGLIVSAAVGGLSASGPGGVVAAVPIALVVYTAVSAVCDAIYYRLLGGEQIGEARRMHSDYVQMSQHVRSVLYPRIRQLDALGGLVELLGQAAAEPTVTDQIIDNASALFTTMRSRERVLGRGDTAADDGEKTWLAAHLKRQGLMEEWAPAVVERVAQDVHRVYWSVEPHLPRTKISAEIIWKEMERPDEDSDARRTDRHRLVKYLVAVEQKRPAIGAPLTFKLAVEHSPEHKQLPKLVLASDVVELARFVHTAATAPWGPGLTKPAELTVLQARVSNTKSDAELVRKRLTSKGGTSASNWKKVEGEVRDAYLGWGTPLEHGVANPFYRAGFLREVGAGDWKLFRMNLARGPQPKYGYVAIPAGGDEDCLRDSLASTHPYFKTRHDALETLEEITWEAQVAEDHGVFTGMGWRCAPLQLYTATFRFQDEDSSKRQLSQDGYFSSLYEAYCGFALKLDHHKLIGVRPGGLLLSDALRDRLKSARREEFWSLQRLLISRIGAGLFALDELADQAERRVALLAGGGVVVSAWWFVSSRARRELLGVLHSQSVQQALRFEMMEALLELQRVHTLSHQLFDKDSGAATAGTLEEIAVEGVQTLRRGPDEMEPPR